MNTDRGAPIGGTARRRRLLHLLMAVALVSAPLLLFAGSEAFAVAILTVNSSGDAPDLVPGDGICDTGAMTPTSDPECTLRAAIEEANQPGPEREIAFSIPDEGVATIRPASPLPPVTRRLNLDATTQPGFGGAPIVVIDGSALTGGYGLEIRGDDSVIRGVAIRGFDDGGIALSGNRNTIVGDYVGSVSEDAAAGGNGTGVVVFGARNVIGGVSPGDGNVISGNLGAGISLDGAERTEVSGNLIGLDARGDRALPNQAAGIVVLGGADRNTVGPGNVISGNAGHGVAVGSGTTRLEILGNWIGTDGDGSVPVGNGLAGVHVNADQVLVRDNLISGNMGQGLQVADGSAVVRGNLIGTDAGGQKPVPNRGHGIEIRTGAGAGSEIGGTGSGEGNVIAYNQGAGVSLGNEEANRASILSNTIVANQGLGIDLAGPGPTPNDVGDVDVGPNDVLNYPVITRAFEEAGSVDVQFDLDVPVGSYRVEFFLNPSGPDPRGFGEGEVLVSSVNVRKTSASSGFAHTIPVAGGGILTATASRCANPSCMQILFTSEFSKAVTISTSNHAPLLDKIQDRRIDEETSLSFTASASDPDGGDTLTYGVAGEPVGASIDESTGVFKWTPTEAQGPGTYTFTVSVTDDGVPRLTDSETVRITVEEVNQPPEAVNPGSQASVSGQTVDLTIDATDPDAPANKLTFEASGLPSGLAIDSDTGRITGVIQPGAARTSRDTVAITVTDDGVPQLSDRTVFTWQTTTGNRPPTLAAVPARFVPEESRLTFTVRASDPDHDRLSFGLVDEPVGASIDESTGVFDWTPTEAQGPGTYRFVVSVSDGGTPSLEDFEPVTLIVTEVNTSPIAVDDRFTIAEDTELTMDVLANDRDMDLPANTLRVQSVAQPDHGQVSLLADRITYTPPRNFNGEAHFEYTLEDGVARAVGTVSISVTAVNDPPVAVADRFRLSSYRPAALDVLANDFDPDQEPLVIDHISPPSAGTASVVGNEIVYQPVNGWTGTTQLVYSLTDPSGETSEAAVEVVVGNEVLVAAQRMSRDLGVRGLTLGLDSAPEKVGGAGFIDLSPISLLAETLLRALDELKIPLGFLALTVVLINGFGTQGDLPVLAFRARRQHWAVARMSREERLPASVEPGADRAVYIFDPTATGIVSSGRAKTVDGVPWIPVETPAGDGWMPRRYLTEQTDLQVFSDDPRPVRLVHELADRLRRGKSISHLIGSGGLIVALSGYSRTISPEHMNVITSGPRHRRTRSADRLPMAPGEFSAAVAKPLLEAYAATPHVSVDLPHSRFAWIPTECWNMPYLALGQQSTVQPWLVFFEYRDGKVVIAGLGIDE